MEIKLDEKEVAFLKTLFSQLSFSPVDEKQREQADIVASIYKKID
jgi:hypothetical protein